MAQRDAEIAKARGLGLGALTRPLTFVPDQLLGMVADIRSIREYARVLPEVAEELRSIRANVDTLNREVTRMRRGVDNLGDEVVGLRSTLDPVPEKLDEVRDSISPLVRLIGRIPGSRRRAEREAADAAAAAAVEPGTGLGGPVGPG